MTPEQLFEQNRKLAYWALRKWFPAYANDEDMQQIALIGLWRACKAYDQATGCRLTTLAVPYITRQVGSELTRRHYKKRNPAAVTASLDSQIEPETALTLGDAMLCCEGWEDDVIAYVDFDRALAALTPKQRETICGIVTGATQKDIAVREGVGPQAVNERCGLARKKLAVMMG